MNLNENEIDKLGKILLINGTSTKKKLLDKKDTTFVEFSIESAKQYYFDLINNIENANKTIDFVNIQPIEPQIPEINFNLNIKYSATVKVDTIKNDVNCYIKDIEKSKQIMLDLYNNNLIQYNNNLKLYNNAIDNQNLSIEKLKDLQNDLILFHTKFVIIRDVLYSVEQIITFQYDYKDEYNNVSTLMSSVADLFSTDIFSYTIEKISLNKNIIASIYTVNDIITLTVHKASNIKNKIQISFKKLG